MYILNTEKALQTLRERVEKLNKDALYVIEGTRSELLVNINLDIYNKIINTLEKHPKINLTNVFNNQRLGEDISDKDGVEVFELEEDYVFKVGVSFEKTVNAIAAAKNIDSTRIHPPTEIHWYKNEFACVSTKAKGFPLRKEGITLTKEEKKNLYKDLSQIEEANLSIDIGDYSNFYYEKNVGIHFIDLEANITESKIEHFLSTFFTNTSIEEFKESKHGS